MERTENLTEQDYLAIGLIVVNFQRLEHLFRDSYYSFLKERNTTLDNWDIGFKRFLEKLNDLIGKSRKINNKFKRKILTIINKVIKLNEKRNDIIHSSWVISYQNNIKILLNFRHKGKFIFKPIFKDGIMLMNSNFSIFSTDEYIEYLNNLKNIYDEVFFLIHPELTGKIYLEKFNKIAMIKLNKEIKRREKILRNLEKNSSKPLRK